MSPPWQPMNIAASVRARLLNLSRERQVEFQRVLSEFAIERLLYRLGTSPHADHYVLKGATLFKLWSDGGYRATWDLDLLGRGIRGTEQTLATIREVCSMPENDGITFDLESMTVEDIRAEEAYTGVRIRFEAHLDQARIPIQIDIGFGDAVTPPAVRERYPTLLDHEPPRIFAYPRETVVAEKLEAMIALGVTNSRMRDFYDVHILASLFAFDGQMLARAVRATFDRRGTPFSDAEPIVLTREFLGAPERQTLWRTFLQRGRLEGPTDAADLADALRVFLGPVYASAAIGGTLDARWPAGGPWIRGSGS